MTTRRPLPVEVIVTDTGPLITLAACERLELLREFLRPIKVTDVVQAECLRFPEKIGAATLLDWFAMPDCTAQVIPTPFLDAWKRATAEEPQDPASHVSVGIGDASTAWLLRQLQTPPGPKGPLLVLTEDGPFGDGVLRDSFREVHVLSTRALLQVLENYGRIPSAAAIIAEAAEAGRRLSRYMADRPGQPEPGTRTTWADVFTQTGTKTGFSL